MFFVEIAANISADSDSLCADALDFLGDAVNYAVSLVVVDLALRWRARAALLKGRIMGLFGLWVASSTIYHAITAAVPRAELIGEIGLLALAANLVVAGLLYRYGPADSQAMSVWLFTRNDCVAAHHYRGCRRRCVGIGAPGPDITVATIIACLGLSSAMLIIRQARAELRRASMLFDRPAGETGLRGSSRATYSAAVTSELC